MLAIAKVGYSRRIGPGASIPPEAMEQVPL